MVQNRNATRINILCPSGPRCSFRIRYLPPLLFVHFNLDIFIINCYITITIRARILKKKKEEGKEGNIRVTFCDLNHNCGGRRVERQRNLKRAVVEMMGPIIPSFVPTPVSSSFPLFLLSVSVSLFVSLSPLSACPLSVELLFLAGIQDRLC